MSMYTSSEECFLCISTCPMFYRFQPSDSFVGYQPDTPSAIVFTASKMSSAQLLDSKSVEWEKEVNFNFLLVLYILHQLLQVLNLCKSLLLEMASPDALIRLINTPLVEEQTMLCQIYMKEQHHVSLEDFVQCHISTTKGVLMQARVIYINIYVSCIILT